MEEKAKLKPRRQPLFKTVRSRVNFTVTLTSVLLLAVSAAALTYLYLGHRKDALATHARLTEAATAEIGSALTDTERALRNLGDAAAATGTVTVDCVRLVYNAAAKNGYSSIGLAAPSGAVMCDTRGSQLSPAEANFIARAAQNRNYDATVLSMSPQGNEIVLAYPAKNQGGETVAVAFAVFDEAALSRPLRLSTGYMTGLADQRGRTFLTRNGDHPGAMTAQATPPDLITEMLSRKTGLTETIDADGTSRIYGFRSVQLPSGPHYLYVGGDKNVVFRETKLATLKAGTGLLTLSLLIWLLSLGIGRLLLVRKSRKLAEAISQVVQGQRPPESLPYGLGELDGVTLMFEELAKKLRHAEETMEKNIKTRTSAIEYSREISELDKARSEALLASIGEGVVATDTDGRISFLNDMAKEGLFWTPEKADNALVHSAFRLENDKQDIIDPSAWPTVQVMQTGTKLVTSAPAKPFYLRRNDHSRFPVKMTVSPILLNGRMMGTLLIFNDITDEVEFDRRKSEFISIASHQLRSPITAIRWMVDMLVKGDVGALTDKQKDWGQKLGSAAARLAELVDELLNISRLESGIKMSVTENDLGLFLDETLKHLEPLIAGKNQKFDVTVPAAVPKLKFDALVMGEVFKNLVSNASKYSPDGAAIGIAVTVGTERVRVAVKDQGMGIPKSDHNQLFNKFFRAENALKSTISGTGLGLYYCKSAMEMHHGEIDFDSEEGKGSTFWFELPVK